MESITAVIKAEHEKINSFLENVKRNMENKDKLKEAFNKLKWNLEKHFFTEERAIYESLQEVEGEEIANIFEVINMHNSIRNFIQIVEASLETSPNVSFSLDKLKELILSHEKFEDSNFYPILDETLQPDEIRRVIEKFKEVIIG